jgi:hypothetical protein
MNANGNGYAISTPEPKYTNSNTRVNLNFHPGNNLVSECSWWGGPVYYNRDEYACRYIIDEVRDPNCDVYRDSESCRECNNDSFFDFFKRGKCRPLNEGCPSDKGSFRPPISWNYSVGAHCYTCPINTNKCYSEDKWIWHDPATLGTDPV